MNSFNWGVVNNVDGGANGNFLTFSSSNPFSISFTAKRWDGVLEYSVDTQNWYEWDASEIHSSDNVLYLRGIGNTVITNGIIPSHAMIMTSPSESGIKCIGNIMTLLDRRNPETAQTGTRCFAYMFHGCTNLTVAPELPATTLAESCYFGMFYDCTSLTIAPELPAMTLTTYCYASMFYGCTSLTVAPELPATTLADHCYDSMFYDCTSLTIAPELPATTLAERCYNGMFYGCTSLTTAPELPATTLADWCYSYMFSGCISLTVAPELPATTLAERCYSGMFQGCTNLIVAPELPATTLAINCYQRMFYGCTGIKISTTQTDIYQKPWRIPTAGTISNNPSYWNPNMLTDTGGTFTGDPSINTTYYQVG